MKPALAIDQFRTCKVAVLDQTGKFLNTGCAPPRGCSAACQAARTIKNLIEAQHQADRSGNGTAGRGTDEFISEVLKTMGANRLKWW